MKHKILFLVITASIFMQGQVLKQSFIRTTDISTGASVQSWSAGDETITEYVVPFSVRIPVNKKLSVIAVSNSAYATLSSANDDIMGLTDTRLMATYLMMNNKLLFTGGVTLPTGKTKIGGDRINIISALAHTPLAFRVPSFGQGLAINLSGVYAFKINNFILGAGGGFVYKSGFEPFESSSLKYTPGMEVSINAGGETFLNKIRLTMDVTYTLYGEDKFDDKSIFRSGNKILIELRSLFKVSETEVMLLLRERTKGKNEKGIGALFTEDKNSNGNQIDFYAATLTPLSAKAYLKGLAELRYYSTNEYNSNGAAIYGVGSGVYYKLSDFLALDITAKYLTGNLNNKDISTSLTGFDVSAGIKLGF